jgi:hypothetical protein
VSAKALSAKFGSLLLSLVIISGAAFCPARVAPQSPPSNAKISKWRTYRNRKYGFEVKYPPAVEVSEDRAGYIIFKADHADPRFALNISRLRERGKLTVPEFVHDDTSYEQDHSYAYAGESVVSREGVTVYRFQRILGSSSEQGSFFLKNQNEGTMAEYVIQYDPCNGGGCGPGRHMSTSFLKNPYIKLYDEIFSTFRFIEPASSGSAQ